MNVYVDSKANTANRDLGYHCVYILDVSVGSLHGFESRGLRLMDVAGGGKSCSDAYPNISFQTRLEFTFHKFDVSVLIQFM